MVEQLPAEKMSLYLIGLVFVVAGLGFKMTAVPFHFYAPDVYQGTTNINAGLLSVAPKIAGVVALVRLVGASLPAGSSVGWQLVLVLAMMTMTLGNVCALWQKNIRRLMAFSSIAHAGYMLIGFAVSLAVASSGGVGAMFFYLSVYVFATLGTFSALAYLSSDAHEVSDVSELAGLGRSHPWVAGLLAICLFSLAGIPPLAGFWGKLALFSGAVRVAMSGNGALSMWFLDSGYRRCAQRGYRGGLLFAHHQHHVLCSAGGGPRRRRRGWDAGGHDGLFTAGRCHWPAAGSGHEQR